LSIIGPLVGPGLAQVERASITGVVTDKTGAVIPEVKIIVTNEATNTSLTLIGPIHLGRTQR
jgi:hypothetical protein